MGGFSLKAVQDAAINTFRFKDATVGGIVSALLPYIFFGAGAVLLLMIIFSGIGLMTAAGNEKAAAGAKAGLTHAAIGFFIVLTAYLIVQLVAILLGLQDITNIFGGAGGGGAPAGSDCFTGGACGSGQICRGPVIATCDCFGVKIVSGQVCP